MLRVIQASTALDLDGIGSMFGDGSLRLSELQDLAKSLSVMKFPR